MVKYVKAEEAVSSIQSGNKVFIHTAAAAPVALVEAMSMRHSELKDVIIYQLHTEGPAPYATEELAASFNVHALFVGTNIRKAVQDGRGSYIPVFMSEAPLLFRKKVLPLDVALITVSPPDRHGYCSLGVSVDVSKSAVESAGIVIAQINRHMPRSHGDGLIHISQINMAVEANTPLPEMPVHPLTKEEKTIGRHISNLIEDGATLQMGIGNIPNAVLACLGDHQNLGIHSEMFSDGILDLVEKGVINGNNKVKHPHKIVGAFAFGTRRLYDFIDDNPLVEMLEFDYVNDTHVIRQNPKVTAINSAIEIDLSGQVCADSIGSKIYSGVGGQMDFIRGASLSPGGKAIIALPSTTKRGESRIVGQLQPGAGVVTTRAHIHWVVTEYGAANLYGKTLEERKEALISIAHPDHRDALANTK